MNKGFVLLAVSLSFVIFKLYAQDTTAVVHKRHQLGIRISSNDAAVNHSVSYKYFFSRTIAAETLFTFTDPAALGVLVEKHTSFGSSGAGWYWGGGVFAGFGSQRRFGLQGVVGLDFLFPTLPINLSVDWKPEINITKEFSFEPAAVGVTARYNF